MDTVPSSGLLGQVCFVCPLENTAAAGCVLDSLSLVPSCRLSEPLSLYSARRLSDHKLPCLFAGMLAGVDLSGLALVLDGFGSTIPRMFVSLVVFVGN